MRVLFVALGSEQLNVSLLASILRRAGHHVGLAYSRHLFDDRDTMCIPGLAKHFRDDDVIEQAARFHPDVVCFSALTVTYKWMLEVARGVKDRSGAVTIFGGVHASAVPEVVLAESCVDYVCVGEGDIALPYLLDELRKGPLERPLPNIAFRGPDGAIVRGPQMPFIQDLDLLPPFEKDLWIEHTRQDMAYLTMSSRGCPYRCTFCFNNFFANLGGPRATSGRYVRQRSVDHFIAELAAAKKRYGVKHVQIIDDIFTLETAWLKDFARRYRREVGVPFQCLSHAHFLDAERVEALRDAGCTWVQIGVQSADEEYKKRELRRSDKEERIHTALELLHRAGIEVKTDHIFGLPGETMESQELALRFYAQHPGLRRVGTYWLTYLPGTEIIDDGLRAGLLTPEDIEGLNRGDTTFWHRELNVQDPERRRLYLDYEALFRIMPYLPEGWRMRLQREHVRWLPEAALKPLGLAVYAVASALERDPDVKAFIARYHRGLENHLRWRLGRAPRGAVGQGSSEQPLRDPAWDRLYANARAQMEALSDTPAPGAAPPPRRRPGVRLLPVQS